MTADGEQQDQELTPPPTNIDQGIIDSLGLTAEDVTKYDRQKQEEEKHHNLLRERGRVLYQQINGGWKREYGGVYLGLGAPDIRIDAPGTKNIPPSPSQKHLIPEIAFNYWQDFEAKFPGASDKPENRKAILYTKTVIEGYGEAALNVEDWRTSIEAFDRTSEGGIMQNQEVMTRLRVLAEKDKTTGVDIAKAIQEKVNQRRAAIPESAQKPPPQAAA